jgi:hypothetical protein
LNAITVLIRQGRYICGGHVVTSRPARIGLSVESEISIKWRVAHIPPASGPRLAGARVLQLADHVVKGVTGWIAILEAQIVGSKLPN